MYRYWHFYTGESSKVIYKQADAQTVNAMYYGYHTLDNRHNAPPLIYSIIRYFSNEIKIDATSF